MSSLTDLLPQVQELSESDKRQLLKFLENNLLIPKVENFFVEGQEYPVWSPYDCYEAAETLMNLLETKKRHD